MVVIESTLMNFSYVEMLQTLLNGYSDKYEYTADGIFRLREAPDCPKCGQQMSLNGYNQYTKEGRGSVKIGKYYCSDCDELQEEDRQFWERQKKNFNKFLKRSIRELKVNGVSLQGCANILSSFLPIDVGKDTVDNIFNDTMEGYDIPKREQTDFQIIHYDEQHLKKRRIHKCRLTLLDGKTNKPIADEIFADASKAAIKSLLAKHLDSNAETFLVTDMSPTYSDVFIEFFDDEKLVHQYCLFHLNKLIVNEFPKKTTMQLEYKKYQMLNIFFDRGKELQYLKKKVKEEKALKKNDNYDDWLEDSRKEFKKFLHDLKLKRRRNDEGLRKRTYSEAKTKLEGLLNRISSFPNKNQERLRMIERNWKHFVAHNSFKDAPATNNPIENYYSRSLKNDQKKQFRTDEGLKNQMKLHSMKREGKIDELENSLLEEFLKFLPFLSPDLLKPG